MKHGKHPFRWLWPLAVLLAVSGGLQPALAQGGATVSTIGGAFAGYVDGDNTASQFNTPWACALDTSAANLFIVDRGNKMVRKMRLDTLLVTTQLPVLNRANPLIDPVGIALDRSNFFYVADRGNGAAGSGSVKRYDLDSNLRAVTASGLTRPAAVAVDARTNVFIAEEGGLVRKVTAAGAITSLFSVPGAARLSGIALMDNGNVVVSDAGQHVLWVYSSKSNSTAVLAGKLGQAGFTEGAFGFGQLNQPQQLGRGPNNAIIVADRLNHRVRSVTCDGSLSTVYGIDPSLWFSDPIPGVFPGWEDGSVRFAEARDPIGIAVAADGTIFSTEIFYHIVRETTGFVYPISSCGGTTTNAVPNPILSPASGYFPLGVEISVTSPEDTPFSPETRLFYTTDGSEPTTNSLPAAIVDGRGIITLFNTRTDLRSLRVRAFEGTNSSLTISGQQSTFTEFGQVGEIGIPPSVSGSYKAGVGATIALPVIANLKADQALKSLQFLVEVTPSSGAPAIVPALLRPVPMSDNDLIPVVAASTSLPTFFNAQSGTTTKLALAYIGTNTVFSVNTFGVVAMLAISLPPEAVAGQTYTVHFPPDKISATSDGLENEALIRPFQNDAIIEVANIPYRVGDSSPAHWYNAGDFGNRKLDNSDVNNAFFASLGFRVPYSFSDLFDAMDVFPEDLPPIAGGDGKIRFLDWQTILRRSLGLVDNDFYRFWTNGGFRVSVPAAGFVPSAAPAPLQRMAADAGRVWTRQAFLQAGLTGGVSAGGTARVPLWLETRGNAQVAGLQFALKVNAPAGVPSPAQMTFVPSGNVPAPLFSGLYGPSGPFYCAWSSGSFTPFSGRVLLGDVVFPVSAAAPNGSVYVVAFQNVDGAGPADQVLEFESVRGSVSVGVPAPAVSPIVSDEWRTEFFGAPDALAGAGNADPDGDGFTNAQEWAAGTHPKTVDWRLRVENGKFSVRWFGQAGVRYQVQRSSTLNDWQNAGGPVVGAGALSEFSESAAPQRTQFYRIKTLAP